MYQMFKKKIAGFWPHLVIFLAVGIFFSRLFFPPSTFVNPDFGRSDILNILLPSRFILSEHLHNLSFPVWEKTNAQGYPFAGEAIGTFFIPNLLFLAILPFNFAIPTLYLFTFLTAAYGTYYLLKCFRLSNYAALFGSLSYTFSAAMILRVQHLSIEQGLSLLPWAFMCLTRLQEKISLRNSIILSCLLSQILIAFPQLFVYTILLFFTYIFFFNLLNKNRTRLIILFALVTVSIYALALSSVQLLPSYELSKLSQRGQNLNPQKILEEFVMQPKNLFTFINPFILGKASNGTYNSPNWNKFGIFWESTAYIGFIPFILSILGIILLIHNKKRSQYLPLIIITVITVLLALGKYSPFHIFFSFPPLTSFRDPSRFILFTQFFLVIIAAITFQYVTEKLSKTLKWTAIIMVIAITIFDFYSRWWKYNPIGSLAQWTSNARSAQIITNDSPRIPKIITIGNTRIWNDVFKNKGWEANLDYYLFFTNTLDANINVLYKINHFFGYQILPTKRQAFQQSLIPQYITSENEELELTAEAKKTINLFSINYIISTLPIKDSPYEKLTQLNKDNYQIFIYKNHQAEKEVKIYHKYETVRTVDDYIRLFKDSDLTKTVLIERFQDVNLSDGGSDEIVIKNTSQTSLKLSTKTDRDSILVYNDSFYPGWSAKVNGVKTPIYPANINSKALLLPRGENLVEFSYFPKFFILGLVVSLITTILAIILFIAEKKILKLVQRFKIRRFQLFK